MTNISRNDVDVLLRRSGLSLSAKRVEEIHEAWALIGPMLDRIRDSGRDRTGESALVFHAGDYSENDGVTGKI